MEQFIFSPSISYDISFPCLIALFRQVVRVDIFVKIPNPIVSLFTIKYYINYRFFLLRSFIIEVANFLSF